MLRYKDAAATDSVKDLKIAKKFYQDILGLKPVHAEGEEVIVLKSGNSLINVYRSAFAGTNKATNVTWSVGNEIGNIVRLLKSSGVPFEHYDLPGLKLEGDL